MFAARLIASDRNIASATPLAPTPLTTPHSADDLATSAAELFASAGANGLAQFDTFPAPLYATDREGRVMYFNDACVAFAGRTPQLGIDRWCVCARMRSLSGEGLAPEQGPIAGALREGRALRNIETLVERGDGTTMRAHSFPTPAFADDGGLVGAVNLFVPGDGQICRDLRATAQRCRTLAKWIGDRQANDALTQLAEECDGQALILAPPGGASPRN